ncbi:MAG: hypothetical protein Q9O74_05465 [Planctomycetota bacterium]|nr:hypothetical protein [Planctomycetota bacterium]
MTTDHQHDTPAPAVAERLGVLLGDRLCVECGFNLHGQTISREEHYGMLAVRCPECSTLASLQEYPVLGRWGARFGAVLALAWLGAALGVAFFTGLSLYLAAESAAGVTTRPAARMIGEAYKTYVMEMPEQTLDDIASTGVINPTWAFEDWNIADLWAETDWVEAQDIDALTRGHRDGTYWLRLLVSAIPIALIGGAWGVVWSVLLLHRRRTRAFVLLGIIAALCLPLIVLSHWGSTVEADGFGPWISYSWGGGVMVHSIAARELGLLPALLALGAGTLAMAGGLLLGRKIVRGIVRLLLPPNLRGALAVLWHVDGLPSPTGGGKHGVDGGRGGRGAYWIRG